MATKETRRAIMIWASGFHRLWAIYPKRVGREAAEEAFNALGPDDALLDAIITDIADRRSRSPWREALEQGDLQLIPELSWYLIHRQWTHEKPIPGKVVPFRRRATPLPADCAEVDDP